MGKSRIVAIVFASIIALAALVFVAGYAQLRWRMFFEPKHENVSRTVFENTQSYVHGKVQDLARYKVQYDSAETAAERQTIKSVIVQQFAQFDSEQIVDSGLRRFLTEVRGY